MGVRENSQGAPSFVGPAVIPGHMITFWLWIALRQIEAIETHSGYDFPWTPTKFTPFYGGPDYHHYVGGQILLRFSPIVITFMALTRVYRYQKKVLQQVNNISISK